MTIDKKMLEDEKEKLKFDFDNIKSSIDKTKQNLVTMQNNLNAVYGAIQQIDKLLPLVDEDKEKEDTKVLLTEKEKAVSTVL
jgi:hypothetical protein